MCTTRKALPSVAALTLAACTLKDSPTRTQPEGLTASLEIVEYDCTAQTQIPTIECEALVALYYSTNGPSWKINTGWLASDRPCDWYNVGCFTSGTVSVVSLRDNGLAGQLPPELGNLTNVQRLWLLHLGSNELTGSVPPELGNLGHLTNLDLGRNQLSGVIPSELGSIRSLEHLTLSLNQLSGGIPPSLGTLPNLRSLVLAYNQLSGPLPPELGALSQLTGLGLSDNQLSGSIPRELGNLDELSNLSLGNNDLSGEIPTSLASLSKLRALQLAGNRLTGPIPPELGQLTSLVGLRLQYNQLTGTIPESLGNLVNLRNFFLTGNQLDGLIPLPVAVRGGLIPLGYCEFWPGNEGLFMPATQAYRNADLDGDGYICSVPLTATIESVSGELLRMVEELHDDGVLNSGQSRSLTRKIEQVLKLVDGGKYDRAISVAEDFVQQVNDLVYEDYVLTEAQAAPLLEAAALLMELIEEEAGV
jgi:hypothetical protein